MGKPAYQPDPSDPANYYPEYGLNLQIGDLAFQAVMALGTLALLIVGWRSLNAARTDAAAALSASTTAATAASNSVESFAKAERGRLFLTKIHGPKFHAHTPEYAFINVGKTAVIIRDSAFKVHLHPVRVKDGPPEKVADTQNRANPIALPSGEKATNYKDNFGDEGVLAKPTGDQPSDEQWGFVEKERQFLYLAGWIRYDDVFNVRHQLNLFAQWHPSHKGYTVAEYPERNQETEPLE